jgi:DNA-binding transcriptional LysR family regulator
MDLDGVAVFVKVVEAGSFTKAARLLGMPNTTVSAKVARLEQDLGVTLIRRTTRKLHVTPAGRAFYERSARGLSELHTAEAEVRSGNAAPRGLLRITASADVAHSLLPDVATRFLDQYPEVRLEIIVANRLVDLIAEGVDLAIRAAQLKDSTLVARKWLSFTGGLWAAPSYLERRGVPGGPSDLAAHECLIHSRLDRCVLRLDDGERKFELPVQGRILIDDMDTLCAFVRRGNGIGALPDFLSGVESGKGSLVRVLPQWSWTRGVLHFVYPSQPFVPAKVRAFIDLALTECEAHTPGT